MHLKKNRSPEDLESCVQKLSTPQLWMNMKDGLDGQTYVVIVYLDGTFEGEDQEDEVEDSVNLFQNLIIGLLFRIPSLG